MYYRQAPAPSCLHAVWVMDRENVNKCSPERQRRARGKRVISDRVVKQHLFNKVMLSRAQNEGMEPGSYMGKTALGWGDVCCSYNKIRDLEECDLLQACLPVKMNLNHSDILAIAFKASVQNPSAKQLSVVDLSLVSIKKATSCPSITQTLR